MKIKETIGIDISKKDFDVRIHSNQFAEKFENNKKGFNKLLKWVYKSSSFGKENILFVFEHTGLYSYPLSCFLGEKDTAFSLVPGLEIKRSLGISRGKDDNIDAKRIALYAYRLRDEIKPYQMPKAIINVIKNLFSLRKKLVKDRASYKTRLKEQLAIYQMKKSDVLFKSQDLIIKSLTKQIDIVEQKIDALIKEDKQLLEMYNLIMSIKSVGKQTTVAMIVYTHAFSRFKNARQFAAYCGIAPFPHQSGTSIRGKTKVSHLANKQLKSLLDMCAVNAIRNNPEMKSYYQRRVEIGKNKISTINVVRNKLLARIFAVINRKTPYVNTMKFAA